MILADVFPVFCPQVLVPSSHSSWSRFNRPDFRQPKMSLSPEKQRFNLDNVPKPFSSFPPVSSPLKNLPFPANFFDRNRLPVANETRMFPVSGRMPTGHIGMARSQDIALFRPGALKRGQEVADRSCSSGLFPVEKRHFRKLNERKNEGLGEMKAYRKHGFGHSKKLYTCPQCKYVTDRKNNLKRHITTMHQDCSKVLECCGMVFRSKASLRDHVSLFHRSGYRCQYCGRNFCRKALLRRHLTVHSGQKDFTCPQCGYATSHKSNLERHRKIHGRKYPLNISEAFEDTCCSNDGQFLTVSSSSDSSPSPGTSPEQSPRMDTHSCNHDFLSRWSESANIGDSPSGNSSPRCRRGILSDRIRETHGKPSVAHLNTTDSRDFLKEPENLQIPQRANFSEVNNENGRGEENFNSVTVLAEPGTGSSKIDISPVSSVLAKEESRQIRRKSICRMFLKPYKCYECSTVFSHQKELNFHECNPKRNFVLLPPISVTERRTQQSATKINPTAISDSLNVYCELNSRADLKVSNLICEDELIVENSHVLPGTFPLLPPKKRHLDGKD